MAEQTETEQTETGQTETGQTETGQTETGQTETGQTETGQTETGHDEEGYRGPATVVLDGEEIGVEVRLESRHEPFDGRVHWSGRVLVNPRLTELIGNGGAEVELRTGTYAAPGKLSEPDMWGRYRAAGVGHPPFAMDEPPGPEQD